MEQDNLLITNGLDSLNVSLWLMLCWHAACDTNIGILCVFILLVCKFLSIIILNSVELPVDVCMSSVRDEQLLTL